MGVLTIPALSFRLRRPDPLTWVAIAIALAVLLPIAVLGLSWLGDESEVWRHLADTVLASLIGNTLLLLVGVGAGVLLLGVSLAWMTATVDFPGRRFFDWALLLPLAMPAYVLAFVALDLLDYAGPVQSFLRDVIPGYGGGSARKPALVIITLSLVLYPYVYLLSRMAFLAQGRTLMEQGRILGLSPTVAFWRVAIPMARPAIAAGLALALMETLADFGAVSVFNFDTFTTAIYKSWYGFYNLNAAAQLASLLLLFVLVSLFFERAGRGRARYEQQTARTLKRIRPGRMAGIALFIYAAMVFSLAFAIPLGRLLFWVIETGARDLDARYWALVWHTLLLGVGAALVTVTIALFLAYVKRTRNHWLTSAAVRGATVGYAMPGSVLAVGIMLSFAAIDRWLSDQLGVATMMIGGLLALILAYAVRFLAVAYGPVEAAFERIRPRILEAARTLGATPTETVRRVWLPLLTPGVLSALLLVLIDVMKEMPATLLLRPFGWDTLAVRIFEMTSEGEWSRAALPALTLVLVGLLPVYLLMKRAR